MKIIELNYEENKAAALQELTHYFNEQFPELATEGHDESKMLKEATNFSFAFVSNHEILGRIFGEIDTFNSTIRINGLIIDSKSRGTGAGKKLMEKVEELGRNEGCHMSFVNTTLSTAPGFYEKLGYQCIEKVKDYPVAGDVYFYYFKRIN